MQATTNWRKSKARKDYLHLNQRSIKVNIEYTELLYLKRLSVSFSTHLSMLECWYPEWTSPTTNSLQGEQRRVHSSLQNQCCLQLTLMPIINASSLSFPSLRPQQSLLFQYFHKCIYLFLPQPQSVWLPCPRQNWPHSTRHWPSCRLKVKWNVFLTTLGSWGRRSELICKLLFAFFYWNMKANINYRVISENNPT